MIERVVDYLANAVWQLPLLAVGAWWLLRSVRLRPGVQHGVWIAVLGLGVLLPLARVGPVTVAVPREIAVRPLAEAPVRLDQAVLAAGVSRAQRKPVGSRLGGLWRRRSLRVSAGVARGIAAFFVAAMWMGLLRILLAWRAARRVVRESREIVLGDHALDLMEECGRRLGVGLPVVAESAAVSGPAIVGVVAPVLLVPEGFAGYAEDDLRAVLLHEMAHIRRRDYGANLLCEVVALPVVWHPVAHVVRRRIRSTREMVCDGIAAEAMGSGYAYALALIELAKACVGNAEAQPMAVGLFTNNNLEERVMQLMEIKQAMGVRAKAARVMGAVVGMAAVVALAAVVHVTPAMAEAAEAAQAPASTGAPATAGPSGAPVTAGPSGAPAAQNAPATGVSVPPVEVEVVPKGTVQEDKVANEPLAMAHGDGAKVEPQEGAYIHRWTAADGQPFEVLTRQAVEPSDAEKKRYEQQFDEGTADLDKVKIKLDGLDVLKGMDEIKVKLDSGEVLTGLDQEKLKVELAKLQDPKVQVEMKLQMEDVQAHLGEIKIDDAELQKQMSKLNIKDMKRQMNAAQKQLMESKGQTMVIQKDRVRIEDKALQEQMADLDRQLNVLQKQQIDKQVKTQVQVQVREQLEEARKHLDEARRQMEESAKERKSAPCTKPCSAPPQ
jgi:beta-lactamase regulating signal transducer with metallopeptidase domain